MPRLKRILTGLLGLIFILAFSFIIFISRQYTAPILMYHSVCPGTQPSNRLAVTPEIFQRQMDFLKTHKYNVMPLEALADLIKQKKKIPPKTLAITFDDGYLDNYAYAFPILKKYQFPAAIFVIIGEIGRPDRDRLGWDEIKAMQASGIISFGSHTLGAKPLIDIGSDEEIKRQIFASKQVLEENLGQKVNMFSYPGGRFTPRIRQLVIDAGYLLAAATSPGKTFANDDLFALKRLRISANCGNMFVFWAETSGFYTFIKERRDGR